MLPELLPPSKLRRQRKAELLNWAILIQAFIDDDSFLNHATKEELATYIEDHWAEYQESVPWSDDSEPPRPANPKDRAQKVYEELKTLASQTGSPCLYAAKNAIGDWLHSESLKGVLHV